MRNVKVLFPFLALLAFAFISPSSIHADDAGELRFEDERFIVQESAGSARITLERKSGDEGAVSAVFETRPGTAKAGEDYEPVQLTLTWSHGEKGERTVTVPILDDQTAESSESLTLHLVNLTGGVELDDDRGTATLEIRDNDPSSPSDPNDNDDNDDGNDGNNGDDDGNNDGGGDGGGGDEPRSRAGTFKFSQRSFLVSEQAGLATIVVERSRGEDGPASVSFVARGQTATSGEDFESTSGTLHWPSGDGTNRSFTITILPDTVNEGVETVELLLEAPTGGALLDAERSRATLSILDGAGGDNPGNDNPNDNDPDGRPGVFKFDFREFTVVEGAASVLIAVERSQGETGAASVRYSTLDESAEAGSDYGATSGTLNWPAGDGSVRTFSVPIHDDPLAEGNETFRVVLSDAQGASIDPARGTAPVQILDDDTAVSSTCQANGQTLCLLNGALAVEVDWTTASGRSGPGTARTLSDKSGLFWFFDSGNFELLVKAANGCSISGSRWLYFAGTTNVGFTLRVTESASGLTREYKNLSGQVAIPVADTTTFNGCKP